MDENIEYEKKFNDLLEIINKTKREAQELIEVTNKKAKEVEEKYRESQNLLKGNYQTVIKDIFEEPTENIIKKITVESESSKNEIKKSALVSTNETKRWAIGSIIISLFFTILSIYTSWNLASESTEIVKSVLDEMKKNNEILIKMDSTFKSKIPNSKPKYVFIKLKSLKDSISTEHNQIDTNKKLFPKQFDFKKMFLKYNKRDSTLSK